MQTEKLNLVGTGCPMNFVTIKTTLDRLGAGERLEVRLDPEPVAGDVAASLRENGYDVLAMSEERDAAVMVVRRRPAASSAGLAYRRRRTSGGCTKASRRKRFR